MKKSLKRFIKSRQNRDNFWNLMFFLLWNLGLGMAFLVASIGGQGSTIGSIAMLTCWVMIPGIPYFIKRKAGITFDKEKKQFLNSEGQELNSKAPNFFFMIVLTAFCVINTGLIFDSMNDSINDTVAVSIIFIMITLIPTLYCILKNFPIIVYFKKEAWIGNGEGHSHFSNHALTHHPSGVHNHVTSHRHIHSSPIHRRSSESMMSGSNMRTSNVNSWYSGNIHHSK